MALQGTVESFPVIEVVRLLAGGGHTGRLSVQGDRSTAVLWVAEGTLLGGDLDGVEQIDPVRLVSEALRNRTGEFAFEVLLPEAGPSRAMVPSPLTEVLPEAAARLDEWSDLERVIPSVAHRLRLTSALAVESVTLDRAQWALVVSAAHRPEVRESATELGMDELTACRMAAEMVGAGLLVVEGPDAPGRSVPAAPAPGVDAVASYLDDLPYDLPVEPQPVPEPVREPVPEPVSHMDPQPVADLGGLMDLDTTSTTDQFAGRFPIDDLVGSGPDDDWGVLAEPAPPVAPDPFAALSPTAVDGVASAPTPVFAGLPELADPHGPSVDDRARLVTGPVDEVELQRQLADLSPRAAEAIAAALRSMPDAPAD